jgi:thioredoxin 1
MWNKTQKFLYVLMGSLLSLFLLFGCSSEPLQPIDNTASRELKISLPGTESNSVLINELGNILKNIQIDSSDMRVGIEIPRGTILLDENGIPLQYIKVGIDPLFLLPPENAQIIGDIVDIQPYGAVIKPALKLSLSYDPGLLKEGVNENDLWIYNHTGNGWNMVAFKQLDIKKNRLTTSINSFGKFGVLAAIKSPLTTTTPAHQETQTTNLKQSLTSGKPTLAEFGRGTCIPCKEMKPILENLAIEYQDRMNVSIVSVDEYSDLTGYYKIMAIPTQIIFDSGGKEIYRHVGFWAKNQIVTQLGKLGIK